MGIDSDASAIASDVDTLVNLQMQSLKVLKQISEQLEEIKNAIAAMSDSD